MPQSLQPQANLPAYEHHCPQIRMQEEAITTKAGLDSFAFIEPVDLYGQASFLIVCFYSI